jgi:hypothetical protein
MQQIGKTLKGREVLMEMLRSELGLTRHPESFAG